MTAFVSSTAFRYRIISRQFRPCSEQNPKTIQVEVDVVRTYLLLQLKIFILIVGPVTVLELGDACLLLLEFFVVGGFFFD